MVSSVAEVSRETVERLSTYHHLLRRWSAKINLTSFSSEIDWASRIEESLKLTSHIPEWVQNAIDFGSGAGIPAVPIALVRNIAFTLVDADRRKAAFLREVARQTRAPITVHACRVESLTGQLFDLITSQAMAKLPKLLEVAYPRQLPDTLCIFPKGRDPTTEIVHASAKWEFDLEQHPAALGTTLVVRNVRPRSR